MALDVAVRVLRCRSVLQRAPAGRRDASFQGPGQKNKQKQSAAEDRIHQSCTTSRGQQQTGEMKSSVTLDHKREEVVGDER